MGSGNENDLFSSIEFAIGSENPKKTTEQLVRIKQILRQIKCVLDSGEDSGHASHAEHDQQFPENRCFSINFIYDLISQF